LSSEISHSHAKVIGLNGNSSKQALSMVVPKSEVSHSKFFQLEPFPSKRPSNNEIESLIREYYDAAASTYDQYTQLTPELCHYNRTLDLLADQLISEMLGAGIKQTRPSRILSITPGTGRREEMLVRKHKECILEIANSNASTQMLQFAAARGLTAVEYWQDIANQSLSEQYNLILALGCSEHWSSINAANRFLRNAFRVIAPGGIVLIDFFNIDDRNGWGPKIGSLYSQYNLEKQGFELGEYFYRRTDLTQVSYSRYFSFSQILTLVMGNGLETLWIKRVNQKNGEILNCSAEGNFIMCLRRTAK
jgi:SAM-dependent methyltransferase